MKIPFTKINIFEIKTEGVKKFNEPRANLIELGNELSGRVRKIFGRSLFIRLVDSGSCNVCENELSALTNPYYDIERFGLKFVASPRHADILMVTGCVTRNMLNPMLNTYESIPAPKFVISVGDCAGEDHPFRDSYSIMGSVKKWLPVKMHINGCPPEPEAIISSLNEFMISLKKQD